MVDDGKEKGVRLRLWVAIAIVVGAAAAAAVATAVLVSVFEHKQEAKDPFVRVVALDDETTDPAVWGKNFPLQYDDYLRTVDMVRTRYGGSEAMVRAPDTQDPRSVVAQQKVEEDPRLKVMWAGYAFAEDFREERGHAYMLSDQVFTRRQVVAKQPGTCLHCHASVYVAYKKAGDGDLIRGFEKVNQLPYMDARALVEHPVACIDCHDPDTMALRVTRPGFLEGIRAYKASVEGIADYDPNTMATRQEMRTYVCGQCHVEYYFKGPEKRLTYPWTNGLKGDQILAYYEESGFKDWEHATTGAPALKAQHPEFETWTQGTHARAGVACADCHMPYKRVGALKISDHHVRSPLLNINRACQTCHKVPEQELKDRAETIQARHLLMRDGALDALVALIGDIGEAREGGAPPEQIAAAQKLQRKAQFLLDFAEAENSAGFHAPQESARILHLAVDYARQGQVALRDAGFRTRVLPATRGVLEAPATQQVPVPAVAPPSSGAAEAPPAPQPGTATDAPPAVQPPDPTQVQPLPPDAPPAVAPPSPDAAPPLPPAAP